MMTAEEIIAYLQEEMADAYELYDTYKGKNAAEAFGQLVRASTIEQLLDAITNA